MLTKEIKAQGYTGSDQTVRRYLRPFRLGRPTPPSGPPPPTVREVTGWILRRPDALDPEEQTRLKEILARCPHLDATSGYVAAFAEIMSGLRGDRLDGWTPRSNPTACLACVPSPPGCGATTKRCATG